MAAFRGGVNYYDTAYVYPGSEAALGEILERNRIRGQVSIATKLPHYLIKSADSCEKYFKEQLSRLRTDYIDYYLMHMLTDVKIWERLKALGILEWLEEKKKSGAIRQIGFSYHGNSDMFCQLVDRLPREAEDIFKRYSVKYTPAQWALRWLWNQPEVTCVLSGMNSEEMVADNLRTASESRIGELGRRRKTCCRAWCGP